MGSARARESGDWSAVSEAVKSRAADRGLTQQQLAAKSGLSVATIQELWRAVPRRRPARTLEDVSEALGWPKRYLETVLQGESLARPEADADRADVREEIHVIQKDLAELTRRVDALVDRLAKDS